MINSSGGHRCWNCRKTSDEPLVPAPETDSVFTLYVCKNCYKRIQRFASIALIILVICIIALAIIVHVL